MESVYTLIAYRGFESLSLRQSILTMQKTTKSAYRSTHDRTARLMTQLSQTVGRAREVLARARNTRQVTINRRALSTLQRKKKRS